MEKYQRSWYHLKALAYLIFSPKQIFIYYLYSINRFCNKTHKFTMLDLKIDFHLSTFIAPTIFIIHFSKFRSSHLEVLCKKGVIINFVKFTGKHLCQRLFFNNVSGLRPATFLKKESLIQVFSHGFCEMSKNSFFYRTPPVAASASCI